MIGNRIQPYKYSLKTAGYKTAYPCSNVNFLYLVPPEDAITIENLRTHISFRFNSTIPSANQYIRSIGIVDTIPGIAPYTYRRMITVNKQADANRVVDLDIEISKLLKKDNVFYWNGSGDYPVGATFICLEFDIEINNYPVYGYIGEFFLWKADGLFTTKGIR